MQIFKTLLLMTCLTAVPLGAIAAGGFTLSSPGFTNHGTIPMAQVFNGSGCKGQNISPALHWSGAPAGTKSYAITIYDPDARGGWWHWLVFNIPASVTRLPADAGAEHSTKLPPGAVQARNDFGFTYYGGPCPPVGDPPHHYQITVYALGIARLPANSNATGPMLAHYLDLHTLAKTHLAGLYERTR